MPRPMIDVNGPEYRETLRARAMHRRYGTHYKNMKWAEETVARLEKKMPYGDYTDKDRADIEEIKRIYAQVFFKTAQTEPSEPMPWNPRGRQDGHITSYYIWRTQGDDKVRPEHAALNGRVFSWNDAKQHPGEDYGCRCWAEPVPEVLEEKARQDITSMARDIIPPWTWRNFLDFYSLDERQKRIGSDQDVVTLLQIGHLQNVINAARVYIQEEAGGGTIFNRVAREIFGRARQKGAGTFPYNFERSYKFGFFVWSIGKATVKGRGQVHVADKDEFLIISGNLNYDFHDRFTDPYDIWNVIPGEINVDGMPYHIAGSWSTRIEAIIKKDSKASKFPDNML